MYLKEMRWGVDWIGLAHDKWRVILNVVTKLLVRSELFNRLKNC